MRIKLLFVSEKGGESTNPSTNPDTPGVPKICVSTEIFTLAVCKQGFSFSLSQVTSAKF